MNRHAVLFAMLLLAGCHKPTAEEAPRPGAEAVEKHADEKEHEELPRLVKLTPEVIAQAKVTTAPAEKRALAKVVELTGQVVPDPDHLAMLGARAPGRVLKVLAREGDPVKAGQVVVLVTSPELARQRAQLAAASAKAAAAQKNAARLRSLATSRLGSDQDALAAEAEATAASAERDAVAQAIRGMGASLQGGDDPSLVQVTSPIAGQVVQRDAVPGQVVEPNHTLATVADLSRVWFQAQLFEKDLSRIEEGASAEVRLNGYPDLVLSARVARLSSQVDPQSHTLTARLTLADPQGHARLGMFGKARISLPGEGGEPQVVVPLSAVTDIGEKKVVFVRHPDGDYELHEVTLGDSAGGAVAVLAGVDAGEQVVVSGVHTLKSAVLKSTMKDED